MDLNNKSIADRQETRYSRDSSEYVRSKTTHAEKHSAGNQHDPYSQARRRVLPYSSTEVDCLLVKISRQLELSAPALSHRMP